MKINFGIDLGTTNSSIASMQKGEPVIIKTDMQKDTMPSCVSFNKRKMVEVGDKAWNVLKSDKLRALSSSSNTFIEFKRTMGMDKLYKSSHMEEDFSSIQLSAEILKKLKSFVKNTTINSIVITVPAKFTANQKDATREAAILAGFKHCLLLQEPIAASLAYGLKSDDKDGVWLVFDLGGGTFDVALLKVDDGIMKIIDTEGDNFLGGKNLDYALVDKVIIPYLKENYQIDNILSNDEKKNNLREAMKFYAEEAKIQLSFSEHEEYNILSDLGDIQIKDDNEQDIELDIVLRREELKQVSSPIFQKTIDLCLKLLERNNISSNSLNSVLLIGGPTMSPILQEMLKEQLTPNLNMSIDPMTAVAKGAAIYASTKDIPDEIVSETRDNTKLQLDLGYEPTTVEIEEEITLKIKKEQTEEISDKYFVEIERSDKAWSSGKIAIGKRGELIPVFLAENKSNSFHIIIYDENSNPILAEPDNFSIIHGVKTPPATLPYNIGIEVFDDQFGRKVFQTIKGLEKNKSLPAKGSITELKTQQEIKAGNEKSFLEIPIYQGEHDANNTRAIYNEHVYSVIISGKDLPKDLFEGSFVNLNIDIDESEQITLKAHFPSLDISKEIPIPKNTSKAGETSLLIETKIKEATNDFEKLNTELNIEENTVLKQVENDLVGIQQQFEAGHTDYDCRKNILNNLCKCFKTIDLLNRQSIFPKIEQELIEWYERVDALNREQNEDEKTSQILEKYKGQIIHIRRTKNEKQANEITRNLQILYDNILHKLLGGRYFVEYLVHYDKNFNDIAWRDPETAQNLIETGLRIADRDIDLENRLRPVLAKIEELIIYKELKINIMDDLSILKK